LNQIRYQVQNKVVDDQVFTQIVKQFPVPVWNQIDRQILGSNWIIADIKNQIIDHESN